MIEDTDVESAFETLRRELCHVVVRARRRDSLFLVSDALVAARAQEQQHEEEMAHLFPDDGGNVKEPKAPTGALSDPLPT